MNRYHACVTNSQLFNKTHRTAPRIMTSASASASAASTASTPSTSFDEEKYAELVEYAIDLSDYYYKDVDEVTSMKMPVLSEKVQQQLDSCGFTIEKLMDALCFDPDIDGLGECRGGGWSIDKTRLLWGGRQW
jgi:hypothetical protein